MKSAKDNSRKWRKAALATGAVLALTISQSITFAGGGGNVMPPPATPNEYSLADMAKAMALFTTSGNNPAYYPNTPFQVLFLDFSTATYDFSNGGFLTKGGNSFNVPPGTPFYVPLWNADDSPPVAGVFPVEAQGAVPYFFDPNQIGGRDFEIIVDGKSTPVGPGFLAGPVTTDEPLLDGGGTHIITLGVFLSPMSVGTHTVTIRGGLYGDLVVETYPDFKFFAQDITYIVRVVPAGKSR